MRLKCPYLPAKIIADELLQNAIPKMDLALISFAFFRTIQTYPGSMPVCPTVHLPIATRPRPTGGLRAATNQPTVAQFACDQPFVISLNPVESKHLNLTNHGTFTAKY
jgi:hypothetical protein